jgi:hypothetical protein
MCTELEQEIEQEQQMVKRFVALKKKYLGSTKPMDIDTVCNADYRIKYHESNIARLRKHIQ